MSEANKSHRTGFPHVPSWPLLIETAAFALYFFTWKLCMAVALARAPRLAEVGVLGSAYALLLAFTGLGYVLFWVARSYLPTQVQEDCGCLRTRALPRWLHRDDGHPAH